MEGKVCINFMFSKVLWVLNMEYWILNGRVERSQRDKNRSTTRSNLTRLPSRTPSRCYVKIQLVFGGVVSEECSFGNQRLSRPIILVFGRFFMFFFLVNLGPISRKNLIFDECPFPHAPASRDDDTAKKFWKQCTNLKEGLLTSLTAW